MRLKLLCCEIFCREASQLVAESPNTIDVEYLPKGLHDLGSDRMVARLQERIDAVPEGVHQAILLGYALCNNGIVGLRARQAPLVVPRGHDCIALFMGDRRKYQEYFKAHPGTYYRTTGWYEREDASTVGEATVPQRLGLDFKYLELVEKFGEDNAKYIMETMGDMTANYSRVGYICVGLACEEAFRQRAMKEAEETGWTYDEIRGSLDLLRNLIDGAWNDDFLVVEPGQMIAASHDDGVVRAVDCPEAAAAEVTGTVQ